METGINFFENSDSAANGLAIRGGQTEGWILRKQKGIGFVTIVKGLATQVISASRSQVTRIGTKDQRTMLGQREML